MKTTLIVFFILALAACHKTETPVPVPNKPGPDATCVISKKVNYLEITTYTQDTSGKIVESVTTDPKGKFLNVTTYEYADGVLSGSRTYSDPAKSQFTSQITYEKQGGNIIEKHYDVKDGQLAETNRSLYRFTDGKLSSIEHFKVENGISSRTGENIVELDSNGNVIKNATGDMTVLYTYDNKKNADLTGPLATILPTGKNNQLSSSFIGGDGKEHELSSRTFMYNEQGLPVSSSEGATYEYNCK